MEFAIGAQERTCLLLNFRLGGVKVDVQRFIVILVMFRFLTAGSPGICCGKTSKDIVRDVNSRGNRWWR